MRETHHTTRQDVYPRSTPSETPIGYVVELPQGQGYAGYWHGPNGDELAVTGVSATIAQDVVRRVHWTQTSARAGQRRRDRYQQRRQEEAAEE